MSTYYQAVKPTDGGRTVNEATGRIEYGNICGHKHRSAQAAERCAAAHEAPGFREWMVVECEEAKCHVK